MKQALLRAACLSMGMLICHAAWAQYQGRSVGDILNELRAEGLVFIYSTQIVSEQLTVVSEPKARHGFALAQEILAPHGLGLSEAAPSVYAVVRDAKAAHRVTPPPAPAAKVEEIVVQTSRYTLSTENIAPKDFLTQDQV